jgi:hypothetical protein
MDLARALIQLERFGDAFDALDEATAVFERVGDVPGLAGLAINVSLLRLLTGARISAARCFRQAEDLYARAWCVPVQDTTPRIAVEKTVIASFADVSVSWVNWLAMYTRRYQEKALGHLGAIVVGDLDG